MIKGIGKGFVAIGLGSFFLLFGVKAQAQSELSLPASEISMPATEIENEGPSHWLRRASLLFSGIQYVSSQSTFFREEVPAQSGALMADLRLSKPEGFTRAGFHGAILHDAGQAETYYRPYELFAQLQLSERSDLAFGRKSTLYSSAERFWKMGMFEPRFLEEKLHPDYASLFGLFYEREGRHTRLSLMATPIFIPELGANSRVEHGDVVSPNPWFMPPPSSVRVLGQSQDIRYRIKRPAEADVIFHPGAALAWERQYKESHMRLAYAYKPMNQLLLGFPFYGDLNQPDVPVAVTIYPRVLYHRLSSIDFTQQLNEHWQITSSAIHEKPIRDSTPAEWITKETEEATLGSVILRYDFGDSAPESYVSLGLMNLWGGDTKDQGRISFDTSVFERRFNYQRAIQVGGQTRIAHFQGRPVLGRSQFLYDQLQNAAIFSGALAFRYDAQWSFNFAVDLMGVLDNRKVESDDGFIRSFRSNDRMIAGAEYVF